MFFSKFEQKIFVQLFVPRSKFFIFLYNLFQVEWVHQVGLKLFHKSQYFIFKRKS
jgi:hypothetical protein